MTTRAALSSVARRFARIRAPLSVKLQLVVLLIIAVVLGTGLVSLLAIDRIDRQVAELERLQSAVTLAQAELNQSIMLQGHLSSLLVLTGDASYRARLLAERQRFRQALTQLAASGIGAAEVARTAEAFRRYEKASDAVAVTKQQGLDDYALELHVKLERVIAGEIELSTRDLVGRTRENRQAELAKILRERRQANWVVGGCLVLSTILAVGIGALFARSIVHPIRQVDAALERIARGEFASATEVANRDELGSLAANLNRMSAQLAELYTREREATQKLRERFESLRRAQAQVIQAEKLRALGEMAGGVAHDFNNLLTVILGQAQYLLKRQASGALTPDDARRRFGIVEEAALDGAKTVRRLMEFTRSRSHPHDLEIVVVPDLVASVLAAAQPRWKDEAHARGRPVEVVTDLRDVSSVAGNPAELREVLLNLVFNALDAMPEGGRLTLSTWQEGDAVYVAVSDTGTGMSEDVAARVFEPFFTTKGPTASGLGLSVSYGIIRRHRGELTAHSRPGEGTTFTIRLPAHEVRAPAGPASDAPPRSAAADLRVLVVDDDAEVRHVLADIITDGGHQVWEATNGYEALGILDAHAADLVCTDLGMPEMTGWQLAQRIKKRWPELKVALVTGWSARIEPEELSAHGVDFLIDKPVEAEKIRRVLADVARS